MSEHTVFLSYARKDDEPFVRKLYTDLHRLGIDAWYDREHMTADGSPFTQAIGDAIRASDRLLFVVGPRSVDSPYCTGEWTLAQSLCIPVVPLLRIGDYDAIPQAIGKGHAVDCRDSREYSAVLDELARLLKDPVHPLAAIGATPALPKAYLARENYLSPLKEAIRSGDPLVAITSKQHQDAAALVGVGGIGKTTIAAALCHDCEVRRTFDVIHWIDAGPNRKSAQDAAPLMRAAANGAPEQYQDIDSARTAFAAYLYGKKTLLVLDDVWDVSLAKAFQFAAVDCRLLITTRQKRIVDLLGAKGQAVDKLTDDEAIEVLSGRAGRVLDDTDARKIVRMLDGHALAVSLAGAWLSQNPIKSAADLLARFAKRPDFRDLNLDAGDKNLNLEMALRLSYDDLTDAARAHFRALGLLPMEASISAAALGALWGIDDAIDAEDAIGVLVGASLLTPDSDDRYTQHPLLRAYARALLDTAGETDTVFLRYAAYFTEQAEQFDTLQPEHWRDTIERDVLHVLAVGDELVERQEKSEFQTLGLEFATNTHRFVSARMEYQRRAWLEMGLVLSRAAGHVKREILFLNQLGVLWNAVGEKHNALKFYEQALSIFRGGDDRTGEGVMLNNIGVVYSDLGEPHKALEYYEQTLLIQRVAGNRDGEATTLNNIGAVWNVLGEKHRALEYLEQALPMYRDINNRQMEATTLSNIGAVWSDLGEKHKTLDYLEQALPMYRAVGDRAGEARTLNNIGAVWNDLGEKQKALNYFEQVLPIRRAVSDRAGEATTLNNIGGVWDALGEKHKALKYYEQALLLRRVVGDRAGEANTLNNIGMEWKDLGEKHKALEYLEQSLLISRAVGDRAGEAATLHNIGRVWDALDEPHKALEYYEQALPIQRATGDRSGEATTLHNIGLFYQTTDELHKALDYYQQTLPIRRAVGDRDGEAITLFNMSYLVDDTAQAIEYVQQAHDLWVAISSPNAQQHAAPRLRELRGG